MKLSRRVDVRDDTGSAVAEFALVGALLALVFAAILQFGLALHVRNTVTDAAMAGARQASLADQSPEDGAELTRELIAAGIGSSYSADVSVRSEPDGPRSLVVVHARVPVPMLGLLGPAIWNITARAPVESRD